MRISNCMQQYLPEIPFQAIKETDVDSLGLLLSKPNQRLCSFLENAEFMSEISDRIKMVFVTDELARAMNFNIGYLIVKNPRNTFFHLHNSFENDKRYIRNTFDTEIAPSAQISDLAIIPKKNVRIGAHTIVEEFATIYEHTVIEDHCVIRSGARIGGCGFEHKSEDSHLFSVNHYGGTVLHHNVEVQNNTCIDRAVYPWDDTVIGAYTKIDNLVYIGHGAKIGNCCMIVAQVGIGGRTVIGNNVWLGFGATIRNGLQIGDHARINMGSVVTKDVPDGGNVTGNFAIPHKNFIENLKKIM